MTDKLKALWAAYQTEGQRMIPPLSDEEIQKCIRRLYDKCGTEPTDLEFCNTLRRYRKRQMAWATRSRES